MRAHHSLAGLLVLAALTVPAALAGAEAPPAGADFIRGDANGDGTVSVSDIQRILGFLFHGFDPPSCMRSADANDSGAVDAGDAEYLWAYFLDNGLQPPWPFPAPGPDVTHTGVIECAAHGGGSPLGDPAARLRILDASVDGGAEAKVKITIAVSSTGPIAGFIGRLRPSSDIFESVDWELDDLTGTTLLNQAGGPTTLVLFKNGTIRFGLIASASASPEDTAWIPAGEDVAVAEVEVCLKAGTTARAYSLDLEAAELIDAATARAIRPAFSSGTLTVGGGVLTRNDCNGGGHQPPPPPSGLNALFKVGEGAAAPGESVTVPFMVRADGGGVMGYAFSLDFDEEVLQATEIRPVWQRPDGEPYGFEVYHINNFSAVPGSGGVDEGFLIGSVALSLEEPAVTMPAGEENVAIEFDFVVNAETTAATTDLVFLDGGQGRGQPAQNVLVVDGLVYQPDFGDSFIVVNGRINVLPDITTFVRGDSNGDQAVNISDAQYTLGYLFLGTARPVCLDAADADDDGQVDMTDPIATLNFLFAGEGTIPDPYPGGGSDPTPDAMECRSGAR